MRSRRGLEWFLLLLSVVALGVGQTPSSPHPVAGQRAGTPVHGEFHAKELSREAVPGPPERELRPGDPEDDYGAQSELVHGGSLYAGRVLSVTVKSIDPLEDPFESGPVERGTFRFRVDRTVVGPPQKELTLGYWTRPKQDWPKERPFLTADWGSNASPWGHGRPQRGEHLLLLLTADKRRAENLNGVGGGAVWHVWRGVGAEHALVRGFEDAARYLHAKDARTRDELFRKLCRSDFRSIREFARYEVFFPIDPVTQTIYGGNYDPVRQSRLALEFLRLTVPKIETPEERAFVTSGFGHWLQHYSSSRVTEALVLAFEKWYLAELETGNILRCKTALARLEDLIKARGMAGTLALFKKAGRAGLEKRLRECADSWDDSVRQASRELLQKLGKD